MLVGEPTGIGEWGFSALIEADGHQDHFRGPYPTSRKLMYGDPAIRV